MTCNAPSCTPRVSSFGHLPVILSNRARVVQIRQPCEIKKAVIYFSGMIPVQCGQRRGGDATVGNNHSQRLVDQDRNGRVISLWCWLWARRGKKVSISITTTPEAIMGRNLQNAMPKSNKQVIQPSTPVTHPPQRPRTSKSKTSSCILIQIQNNTKKRTHVYQGNPCSRVAFTRSSCKSSECLQESSSCRRSSR